MQGGPVVGIIANPVSARDIRRVIANATALQITDRANIVLRVLACLKACGVDHVVMMPENGGIRNHVRRGIDRAENQRTGEFPKLSHLDRPITGTVDDTIRAAREMKEQGVAAIVVLGGDGTHRAVVAACGEVPIAGISTGTNNAFPEHREPTITGLAVGLAVMDRVPSRTAFAANKQLVVSRRRRARNRPGRCRRRDRALCRRPRAVANRDVPRTLVTFADPEVIGMSAIAGLLEPVSRARAFRAPRQARPGPEARITLATPIAPGYVRGIGVRRFARLPPGKPVAPEIEAGSIALDGERELSFSPQDDVSITLETMRSAPSM